MSCDPSFNVPECVSYSKSVFFIVLLLSVICMSVVSPFSSSWCIICLALRNASVESFAAWTDVSSLSGSSPARNCRRFCLRSNNSSRFFVSSSTSLRCFFACASRNKLWTLFMANFRSRTMFLIFSSQSLFSSKPSVVVLLLLLLLKFVSTFISTSSATDSKS